MPEKLFALCRPEVDQALGQWGISAQDSPPRSQSATPIVTTTRVNMAPPSDVSLANIDLLARYGSCLLWSKERIAATGSPAS